MLSGCVQTIQTLFTQHNTNAEESTMVLPLWQDVCEAYVIWW